MGEAKRREQAQAPLKIYGEKDICPTCGKLCSEMYKEHNGEMLTIGQQIVVCFRCGNLFIPQSRIKIYFKVAEEKAGVSTIIAPGSEEGLKTLMQAGSIKKQ